MSKISFRGVISVATTVGPSLLFVILHISKDPSIADNRKEVSERGRLFSLPTNQWFSIWD
jgi:hypothetical protein